MEKFYFTYGFEGHPFCGGWTEVEAPSQAAACELFRLFHPNKSPCGLNCAFVYPAESFEMTTMFREGNLGKYCHERISIQREIVET